MGLTSESELGDPGVLGPVSLLWSNPSSYISASLDQLRRHTDVEVVYRTAKPLPEHAERPGARRREEVGASTWIRSDADVVIVSGWSDRRYLWETLRARRRGAVTVLMYDTQPKQSFRYRAGTRVAGPILRQVFDGVYVPGPRQAAVARTLGFSDDSIQLGGLTAPLPDPSPVPTRERRGFVLVARLVGLKGIDTYLSAYARYRASATDPWPATIVGDGPLKESLIASAPDGVTFTGWCAPSEVIDHLSRAGCLVSSSRIDMWGMAIAEGASMGLPLIATPAAGAIEHFVEEGVNGAVVPVDDADALAEAMTKVAQATIHDREQMGARSRALAEQLTPETWVRDLSRLVQRLR